MSASQKESIFDLAEQRATLDAWFEETEGEVTPELASLWAEWKGKLADKVEVTAWYIIELEANAADIREQEIALAERRTARLKRAERLTAVLHAKLTEMGIPKVETLTKTVSIAKNPPKVVELVPTDQPDFRNLAMTAPDFVERAPETFFWNRDAIKAAFKAGTLPDDVSKRVAVQQGTRLAIH